MRRLSRAIVKQLFVKWNSTSVRSDVQIRKSWARNTVSGSKLLSYMQQLSMLFENTNWTVFLGGMHWNNIFAISNLGLVDFQSLLGKRQSGFFLRSATRKCKYLSGVLKHFLVLVLCQKINTALNAFCFFYQTTKPVYDHFFKTEEGLEFLEDNSSLKSYAKECTDLSTAFVAHAHYLSIYLPIYIYGTFAEFIGASEYSKVFMRLLALINFLYHCFKRRL